MVKELDCCYYISFSLKVITEYLPASFYYRQRPPEFTTKHLPRGARKKINSEMTGEQLRLQAIEKMKARAEAHYAQLKAKRKKAGDFHL